MKNVSPYPCIWFDQQGKEAADFYCGIFPNSKIVSSNPIVTLFEINGSKIMCLNGGPLFPQTEAFSMVISCDSQEEIDYYWNHLTKHGSESKCGWLKDQYGVSWQVVPSKLGEWMAHPQKGQAIMEAFLKMSKFDIPTLLAIIHAD